MVGTTDAQTLSAKTLTSPVINGTLSGTAFLDEDDFSSNSPTAVSSQQAIKAYVDSLRAVVGNVAVSSDVTLTDRRLHLVDTTSARSLELPAAAANLFLVVKDATGGATLNAITLTTPGSETIDGAASYLVDSSYESATVVSDGSDYFII